MTKVMLALDTATVEAVWNEGRWFVLRDPFITRHLNRLYGPASASPLLNEGLTSYNPDLEASRVRAVVEAFPGSYIIEESEQETPDLIY
jgi:hypothetical protein